MTGPGPGRRPVFIEIIGLDDADNEKILDKIILEMPAAPAPAPADDAHLDNADDAPLDYDPETGGDE